jgi:argininosuccinate synthase
MLCIVVCEQGNALEDPWVEPDESMFSRSVSPEQAPDEPTYIEIEFAQVGYRAITVTKRY